MTSAQRREKIKEYLKNVTSPVSASQLASEFKVSRQVIVGDIALLRASGADIVSTPRGYILPSSFDGIKRTIASFHKPEDTLKELYTVTDNGGTVQNVIVEHPIYGQLSGELQISSRYDADEFINKVKSSSAQLLSELTGGIHLHTILCKNQKVFDRIIASLKKEGFLVEN